MVLDALRDAARRDEPDRTLAALLAPAYQLDLLALAAFAAEISRIPATVSDPLIGEIRLQWWRDAIEAGARGEATGHPIADAIGSTLRARGLSPGRFLAIIDARAFDLSGALHADEDALVAYFAATEGSLFALGQAVLGGHLLPEHLIGKAGLAFGLARALGRLPALLHNGGFPVPETLLAAHGVSSNQLAERPFAAVTVAGVDRAAKVLADRARTALVAVRAGLASPAQGDEPCGVSAALLPLAMVEPYLRAQDGIGFRRLEHIAEVLPLKRVWCLAKARLTGRL